MREGWERKDVILPPPPVPNITHVQACVANVSVWFQSKTRLRNRIFGFRRTRNKSRVEKWNRGEREGKEWNACRQTPGFWKPRSIANGAPFGLASRTILTCVDQRFVSYFSSPPPPRSFIRVIFRVVCDSRSSFFAPKPHGNACYAGRSTWVLFPLDLTLFSWRLYYLRA